MVLQALFFQNCTGLQLRETKHINSVKNHISLNACNDVVISNVHIIAPENIPNTYGFNISRSNNVLIQNSLIETGIKFVLLRFQTDLEFHNGFLILS